MPTTARPRCYCCRVPLGNIRAGSELDTICNSLVNPRDGKPAAPEGHPEAHQGRQGWRARRAILRRLWLAQRSPAPGWGEIPEPEVRRRLDAAMQIYYHA